MSALLKNFLQKMLFNYLKQFEGVDEKSMEFYLEAGELVLDNLTLKLPDKSRDASRDNSLVHFRSIAIKKLELNIPWVKLVSAPISLRAYDITVEVEILHSVRLKKEILQHKHRLIEEFIKEALTQTEPLEAINTIKKKVLSCLIKNLQVEIHNLNVVFKAAKEFSADISIPHLQLSSVPSPSKSSLIHKLLKCQIEVSHFSKANKLKETYLKTNFMAELEFSEPTWSSSKDKILNLNIQVSETKISLSQLVISQLRKTLGKIPQTNKKLIPQRSPKSARDYPLKLFRFCVRKVIERQKFERFRRFLSMANFNLSALQFDPSFHNLIYRETGDTFRQWVFKALKVKEAEAVTTLYFDRYTLRCSIEQINFLYHINSINSVINIRLFFCVSKIILKENLEIEEASFKGTQLQVLFDKRSVVSMDHETEYVMVLMIRKHENTEEYRIKLGNMGISLNLNQIEKLIRSVFTLVLPQQRPLTLDVPNEVVPISKTKPIYVLQLDELVISISTYANTKRVVNNLHFRRFELGYCRRQVDVNMDLILDLTVQEESLTFQQRFQLDLVLKMGYEYRLTIQKSNIHLDLQKLTAFADTLKMLIQRVKKLMGFFSSKSFQIENSSKLGMLSLQSNKSKTSYFYAFDGAALYLYSYTHESDTCFRAIQFKEMTSFKDDRRILLDNNDEICFNYNQQVMIISKLALFEKKKQRPINVKCEIRDSKLRAGFSTDKESYVLTLETRETSLRLGEKVEVKAEVSLCVTYLEWRVIQLDNMKLLMNQRKNRKLSIGIESVAMDYSHERLLAILAFAQVFGKKLQKDFGGGPSPKASLKQKEETQTHMDINIHNASVYFVLDMKNRFLKLKASRLLISLGDVFRLECHGQFFDMTSYPYSRFSGEEEFFASTHLLLIDKDLQLSKTKLNFMTQPTLRIVNYFLTLLDYYLPPSESPVEPKKSQTKITVKNVQVIMFPTKFNLLSEQVDILYAVDFGSPKDIDSKEVVLHRLVTISCRALISSKSEKILDSCDFNIMYDVGERVLTLQLEKLFLTLSENGFNKLMSIVFQNLLYADQFQLNEQEPEHQPNRLEVNVYVQLASILINKDKLVFEILAKSLEFSYLKESTGVSTIFVDFERIKVNEIVNEKRKPFINDLSYSRRHNKTDTRKRFLRMLSEHNRGPEIEINLTELDILLNLSKLLSLLTFWNYQVNNPGLKLRPSPHGMHLLLIIPQLRLFLETSSQHVYQWSANLMMDYTSNIVRTETSTSSVLTIHVNEVMLYPLDGSDSHRRRQMLNNPNIRLTLEMVQDRNEVHPKSIYNLNLVFEKTRLHLNLNDVNNFYSTATQHFKPVETLPTAIRDMEKKVIEGNTVKEGAEMTDNIGHTQSMYVFEARINDIEVIISSSANEQIVPLLEIIFKCEQFMGTVQENVQLYNLKSNLFLGYFNLKSTRIEPVIETMELVAELCMNKIVDPGTFLSIIIPTMKLNLSDEMYDTLMRVYKDQSIILEESQRLSNALLKSTVGIIKSENVRWISLFSLKNQTGFVLDVVEVRGNDQVAKSVELSIGEYFNYKVEEDEEDFARTFEKSVKFKIRFKDNSNEEYVIKSVKINSLLKQETFIKYFPKKIDVDKVALEKFFIGTMELAEAQYRKEFVLKSKLFFLNQTSETIEVNFSNGKESISYQLKKDAAVPIPFTIFTSLTMVFRIRDSKQGEFSSAILVNKYVMTEQQMEACLNDRSESNVTVVRDSDNTKLILNNYCVYQSFQPKSKIQTVLITPMMRIFNCLPVDLRLDDLNIIVEANSSREITQFSSPKTSVISFEGYKSQGQILLYDSTQSLDRYPEIIYMYHEVGVISQRALKINTLRKVKNGVFLIVFSARTIILNETGVDLTIILNDTSDRGAISLANEDDTLKITHRKNLKTSNPVKLKNFTTGFEIAYYEQTSPDEEESLYEFTLNMFVKETEYSGELVMTRVLELCPKYVVINKSNKEIEIIQPESFGEPLSFKPSERGLLIWREPNKPKQLVLRVFEAEESIGSNSKWKWSGSFSVSTIRFLHLYITKKHQTKTPKQLQLSRNSVNPKAERLFFQVEMKRQGYHTCIVIDEVNKEEVENIILNKTPFTLLVEQANHRDPINKDYFCVPSGRSEPFSWIEPDQRKKMRIRILKDNQVIDTNIMVDMSNLKEEGDFFLLRNLNQRFKVQVLKLQKQVIEVTSLYVEEAMANEVTLIPPRKKRQQVFCTFLLQELGVSIIGSPNGNKVEVFYLQMESFDISIFWAETMKFEARVKMFNIDNNSRYESEYPVFLTSSINLDHQREANFFELVFEREIKEVLVMKIIQLRAYLVPLTIRLDEQLGRILFMFYKGLLKNASEEFKYKKFEEITTVDYVFASPKDKSIFNRMNLHKENPFVMWKYREAKFSSNFVEIKVLEIPTLKINLSFSHVYSLKKDNDQVFGSLYNTFGIVIPSCENAPINVDGIYLEDIIDSTSQALISEIALLYKNQLISNALSIIGSFNILGNPIGFIMRISHGFQQLFQKPRRAIKRGPAHLTLAVFSGVIGVINNGLAAVVHFIYSISKSLSNGIAYLTFDGDYMDKRREKNRFQPDNVFEGMQYSIDSVVFGVEKAVKGIFFCTKRHRDSIGMETIKALAGIITKPTVGVLDGAKSVMVGIENMLLGDVYKPSQQRRRIPRVFYDAIRYFKEYKESDAIVYESLIKRPARSSNLQLIENYHFKLNNQMMDFVITSEEIMLLEDLKVSWSVKPKDVYSTGLSPPVAPSTICKMDVYYTRTRSYTLLIDKKELDESNLYYEFRTFVDNLKILNEVNKKG